MINIIIHQRINKMNCVKRFTIFSVVQRKLELIQASNNFKRLQPHNHNSWTVIWVYLYLELQAFMDSDYFIIMILDYSENLLGGWILFWKLFCIWVIQGEEKTPFWVLMKQSSKRAVRWRRRWLDSVRGLELKDSWRDEVTDRNSWRKTDCHTLWLWSFG